MNMVVNRWFFPVISAVMLGAFYTVDQTTVSPVGLTLATILTFIGVGVIERLDKIIEQKIDSEVTLKKSISDLKVSTLKSGSNWK